MSRAAGLDKIYRPVGVQNMLAELWSGGEEERLKGLDRMWMDGERERVYGAG